MCHDVVRTIFRQPGDEIAMRNVDCILRRDEANDIDDVAVRIPSQNTDFDRCDMRVGRRMLINPLPGIRITRITVFFRPWKAKKPCIREN